MEPYNLKSRLKNLLGKLADVKACFGTITDVTRLHYIFDGNEMDGFTGPPIEQHHISLLKYAVQNGCFKQAELTIPNGWQVVSFLIELRARQQAVEAGNAELRNLDLREISGQTWSMLFEKHGGDYKAAQNDFKMRWGKSPLSDWMKEILNKSFLDAKRKYEADIPADPASV